MLFSSVIDLSSSGNSERKTGTLRRSFLLAFSEHSKLASKERPILRNNSIVLVLPSSAYFYTSHFLSNNLAPLPLVDRLDEYTQWTKSTDPERGGSEA